MEALTLRVVFGAGDGFVYGFDPAPKKDADGFGILKELWRVDANPKANRVTEDGKKRNYPTVDGPSEIIATPVVDGGRAYIAVGQDPEHGPGVGALTCIDVFSGEVLWRYEKLQRSISTVAIANGLVYAADFTGYVHCLNAKTGKAYWVHDTESNIWSSPLVADGKVYVGNEDGVLTILRAGKRKKLLGSVEFPASLYSSPVAANGVLYVTTHTHLYAIGEK